MKYNWRDAQQYSILYKQNPAYDAENNHHFGAIVSLLNEYEIKSILDFGCGQNNMLMRGLVKMFPNINITGYDPSIEDDQCTPILTNQIPNDMKVDLLISTDCLEHIPKEELFQCWKIFLNLTPRLMYHGICTRKAQQILPDGTNAHKTVERGEWWKQEFDKHFFNYKLLQLDIKADYSTFLLKQNV